MEHNRLCVFFGPEALSIDETFGSSPIALSRKMDLEVQRPMCSGSSRSAKKSAEKK